MKRISAVCLAVALAASCARTPGPGQVHLSWQGAPSTTLTATWRSADGAAAVQYGETVAYGQEQTASSTSYGGSTLHRAELTGLAPGTRYHYRCKGAHGMTKDATFATAPNPLASFRFAVFGDSRSDDATRRAVRGAIQARSPSFALFTGDFVQDGTSQKQWDEWFDTMQPLLAEVPLMSAIGNHEANSDLYFRQLALPAHAPSASGYDDHSYYSFDYGDIHFVALSTEPAGPPDGPQARWLEADLARAASDPATRFIIAFGHQPPFSSSEHGSNLAVREAFVPLFERYRVRLSFWGHDHDYERTRPLLKGKAEDGGLVYVVTGGAGAELYRAGKSDFTAFSEAVHHFVEVNVTEAELRIEARDIAGRVFDTFTVHR